MTEIVIDFNRIKRSELSALFADMGKVTNTRDESGFSILDKWMARTVTAWPYAGDPADEATYADMGLDDYFEVIRRFTRSFRNVSNPDDRRRENGAALIKSDGLDDPGTTT